MSQTHQRGKLCRRLRRLFWFCIGVYLLLLIGCASWQRRMIYFPPVLNSEEVARAARQNRLEPWTNAHGELIGWKRMSPIQPALGQVLILHGNAGCAFQCDHYANAIQGAAALDVYLAEYPGYADCPGKPTEKTLDAAAVKAFQGMPTNAATYIVGESLGTGVATYLAGQFPARTAGVVLLAPYNRLADVGQAHLKILPVKWLLRDRFASEEYLRHYHGPVAMLVCGGDTVIPEKFGRRLYDRYAGPKRLWEFSEGNHGTVMVQPPETWKEILEFLGK